MKYRNQKKAPLLITVHGCTFDWGRDPTPDRTRVRASRSPFKAVGAIHDIDARYGEMMSLYIEAN